MSKRSTFTHITPLPPQVTRDLVIDVLHDHSMMITLNPLVTNHRRIDPPSHAHPEEIEAVWYEITDKISYLPGTSFSGSVTYTACFHNLPRGLQTHIFAPAGLEIRGKWQICGNMPGEPRGHIELGMEKLRIPKEGLYLREDVDLRCNIFLSSFAKKNLKKSHAGLVDCLLKKTTGQTLDATDGLQAQPSTARNQHMSTMTWARQPSRPESPFSVHSSVGSGTSSVAGDLDQKHNNLYNYRDSWVSNPPPQYQENIPSSYSPASPNHDYAQSPQGSIHLSDTSSPGQLQHPNLTQNPNQPYRHYSRQFLPPTQDPDHLYNRDGHPQRQSQQHYSEFHVNSHPHNDPQGHHVQHPTHQRHQQAQPYPHSQPDGPPSQPTYRSRPGLSELASGPDIAIQDKIPPESAPEPAPRSARSTRSTRSASWDEHGSERERELEEQPRKLTAEQELEQRFLQYQQQQQEWKLQQLQLEEEHRERQLQDHHRPKPLRTHPKLHELE